MESSSGNFFDVDLLHSISIDRSKKWAQFISDLAKSSDSNSIGYPLNDLENFLSDDSFDDDCDADMAEEVADSCDEPDDGPSREPNTSRNSLEASSIEDKRKGITMINSETGSVQNCNEEEYDLQAVLNETIPVLAEHKRKLKESGVDQILNTFDTQKIDEVAVWLRGHQRRIDERKNGCGGGGASKLHLETIVIDSDTDSSLHSMETARYVRMNMKPKENRINGMPGTTIKTYRTVQSKREAWNKKYACDAVLSSKNTPTKHGPGQLQSVTCHKRRKIMRKRSLKTVSEESKDHSSSSSDCCDFDRRAQKLRPIQNSSGFRQCFESCHLTQRRSLNYPRRLIEHYQNQHAHSSSLCAQRRSFDIHCPMLYAKSFRRESECNCRNDDKLCDDIKHLADTSTEDWMVENIEDGTPAKLKNPNLIIKDQPDGRNFQKPINEHLKSKMIKKTKSLQNINNKSISKKPIKKSHSDSNRKTTDKETIDFINGNLPTNNTNQQIDIAKSTGKVTIQEDQKQDNQLLNMYNEETILSNINMKPQPMSAKLRKLDKLIKQKKVDVTNLDVSFFHLARNVYNSTAISNDSANTKQMMTKQMIQIPSTPNSDQAVVKKEANCLMDSSITINDREAVGNSQKDSTFLSEQLTNSDILVYTPRDGLANNNNDWIQVTENHLKSLIGLRAAKKFFKYYIGPRRFSANASIYFRPPSNGLSTLNISDDSDVDELELMDQCGALYASSGTLK